MAPHWVVLFDVRDGPAWFGVWPLFVSITILLAVGASMAWRAFRNRKARTWRRGDVRLAVFTAAALFIVAAGGTLAIREHASEGRAFENGDYHVAEGVVTSYARTANGKSLTFHVGKAKFEVSAGFMAVVQYGDYVRVAYIDGNEILRIDRRTSLGASK